MSLVYTSLAAWFCFLHKLAALNSSALPDSESQICIKIKLLDVQLLSKGLYSTRKPISCDVQCSSGFHTGLSVWTGAMQKQPQRVGGFIQREKQ